MADQIDPSARNLSKNYVSPVTRYDNNLVMLLLFLFNF